MDNKLLIQKKKKKKKITIEKPFVALQPFPDYFAQKRSMVTGLQPPSFNEQLTSLESPPLFMSALPDDPADNAALSALQSLVHDGTPDGRYTCPPFPSCHCTTQAALTRNPTRNKKRSRRTSRNRAMIISKESDTGRPSAFIRRAWTQSRMMRG